MSSQVAIEPTIQKQSIPQYFSFDVFDTCVTRHCISPPDLFEALFTKLLLKTALPAHGLETAAKSLARSRIQAETTTRQQARQQTNSDDVALAKIYQTLAPTLVSYSICADDAFAEEMEQELAAVSPILSTRRRIQQLRKQGHNILFISDMYLPGSVVRQMLIEHGFTDGSDHVYVSADTGLSKSSGRLFTHVCKQLGIEPKKLHHTGDNPYADIRAAKRLGIQTTHFTQSNATRYESGFRSELIGNDWVRSHLIGISRAVRLRHAPGTSNGDSHAAIASDILGPLLTSYVFWVLITAQQAGIEHLHFADPALLEIAHVISQYQPQASSSGLPRLGLSQLGPKHTNLQSANLQHANLQRLSGQNNAQNIGQTTSESLPSWAITGTFNSAAQLPPHLSPTDQQTDNRQKNDSFYFTLIAPISSAPSSHHQQTHLAYLKAPVGLQKRPTGTLYLVEYRQILTLLLFVSSGQLFPSYRAIVLDYAASFARSPTLKNHLDMLNRYATRNAICFLAEPQLADVQALTDLQTALGTKPTQLMARPIQLGEIPTFLKRQPRGSEPNAEHQNSASTTRWAEGSMLLSSQLVQLLIKGAQRLYDYLAPKKTKWFC